MKEKLKGELESEITTMSERDWKVFKEELLEIRKRKRKYNVELDGEEYEQLCQLRNDLNSVRLVQIKSEDLRENIKLLDKIILDTKIIEKEVEKTKNGIVFISDKSENPYYIVIEPFEDLSKMIVDKRPNKVRLEVNDEMNKDQFENLLGYLNTDVLNSLE